MAKLCLFAPWHGTISAAWHNFSIFAHSLCVHVTLNHALYHLLKKGLCIRECLVVCRAGEADEEVQGLGGKGVKRRSFKKRTSSKAIAIQAHTQQLPITSLQVPFQLTLDLKTVFSDFSWKTT